MFLHARKGHVEPLGKGCDRSVRTPEMLQNAASGGVRERAERGIEVGLAILYHMVQYTRWVRPPIVDSGVRRRYRRAPSSLRQHTVCGHTWPRVRFAESFCEPHS